MLAQKAVFSGYDNGPLSIFTHQLIHGCFIVHTTCCEAKRFSKNASCLFSYEKAPSCGQMTISYPFVHKANCHQGNRLIYFLSLFPQYHLEHIRTPLLLSCLVFAQLALRVSVLFSVGGKKEDACSFETECFSFTCSLINALCYDKLACDRSLGSVFSVITQEGLHNNWLPIQSVTKRFQFLPQKHIIPRIDQWGKIFHVKKTPSQMIRSARSDHKHITGACQLSRQMLLLILSESLLSDCGPLWSGVQMVQNPNQADQCYCFTLFLSAVVEDPENRWSSK